MYAVASIVYTVHVFDIDESVKCCDTYHYLRQAPIKEIRQCWGQVCQSLGHPANCYL